MAGELDIIFGVRPQLIDRINAIATSDEGPFLVDAPQETWIGTLLFGSLFELVGRV